MHPYNHTLISIQTYIHAYIHPCIHPYPYLHTSIPPYIQTHIHTSVHACMHAYIDTCKLTFVLASACAVYVHFVSMYVYIGICNFYACLQETRVQKKSRHLQLEAAPLNSQHAIHKSRHNAATLLDVQRPKSGPSVQKPLRGPGMATSPHPPKACQDRRPFRSIACFA